MRPHHQHATLLLLAAGIVLFFGCYNDPTVPATGFILVTVADVSGGSVSGYEIRITPARFLPS